MLLRIRMLTDAEKGIVKNADSECILISSKIRKLFGKMNINFHGHF